MSDLSIRQYSYISVTSETLTCQEIEDKLQFKADKHEVWGKARLRRDPSFKVTNAWTLIARNSARVDDQIELLIKRVLPIKDRLLELIDTEDVGVSMQTVRHFDDVDGEEELIEEDGDFIKLPGQHQLLGFHLSIETIQFLYEMRASLDIDEYN